eukprot:COSAG06_NODE_6590_length_2864_cov_3.445208_3_plen_87_part_00
MEGLKTNPTVIGVAKALTLIFKEIDEDLQDSPPRRLKDLKMKAGSDNAAGDGRSGHRSCHGQVRRHARVRDQRPPDVAMAESHVGV